MKNKEQIRNVSNEMVAEPEQQGGVTYFMQKFHLSDKDVEDAIKKVGNSSESLEQYFTEQRRNAPF